MVIRIDCYSKGSTTVIAIAGHLSSGDGVAKFKEAFERTGVPCVIDLSNLTFADDEGIDTIRAIMDDGVRIQGASPFIKLLLDNQRA